MHKLPRPVYIPGEGKLWTRHGIQTTKFAHTLTVHHVAKQFRFFAGRGAHQAGKPCQSFRSVRLADMVIIANCLKRCPLNSVNLGRPLALNCVVFTDSRYPPVAALKADNAPIGFVK